MAVKYQDYYDTLGVKRGATAADVQRAYRKLARQYHPDVNRSADAAERFKLVTEAYEVLKEPDKRQRYDQLGSRWKAGQDFTPPPGFENLHFETRGSPHGDFSFSRSSFSDFFESFFGDASANTRGSGKSRSQGRRRPFTQASPPSETAIVISLQEAIVGTIRQLRVEGPRGTETLDVRIPAGVTTGAKIRLKDHGLLLRIRIGPDPDFELDGRDITTDVQITPWEAALGSQVPVDTPAGQLLLTIPPETQSGQKLRIRGKGLPSRGAKAAGDFYARLRIIVPKPLSETERVLFEKLRDGSTFDPRA